MGWIGQLLYAALSFFIPWLQSGSTETHTVSGELSPDKLAGVDDVKLRPSDIPNFLLVLALLIFVSGCAGRTNKLYLAEPGSTLNVIGDEQVTGVVVDDEGNKAVVKKSASGTVMMPKSVYRRLRNSYIELNEIKKKNGEALPPLDAMTPEEKAEEVRKGKPVPQETRVK